MKWVLISFATGALFMGSMMGIHELAHRAIVDARNAAYMQEANADLRGRGYDGGCLLCGNIAGYGFKCDRLDSPAVIINPMSSIGNTILVTGSGSAIMGWYLIHSPNEADRWRWRCAKEMR